MRIAINTRFLLGDRLEGIGRYTYEVGRRLVLDYPQHEFLFLFDRPYDPRFVFGDNVTPLVLSPPARHPLLWWAWFECSVPRALRRYGADVFFSPDGYLSLRSNVPTVLTVHDLAFEHFPEQVPWLSRHYYRYFSPKFCHHATWLLAVSQYTKKDIVRQYGVRKEKIEVCGNGCRDGFQPFSTMEIETVRQQYSLGEPYFLYVGAVHPRKNVHYLIMAFDRFKKRTGAATRLLIVGRFAWQTEAVKIAYEQARHRSDIEFLGFVPDDELPRLMAGAQAFVYPSLFEGFGIPLLEAMHAEVPIITSTASSLPEVAGKAALLVDPLIVDQLAVAMQQLHGQPELATRLVAAGRHQRKKFNWDKTAAVVAATILKAGQEA